MADSNRKRDAESLDPSDEKIFQDPMSGVISEIAIGDDGFRVFPQPITSDKLDPLNWSFKQKHTILSIVMSL